MKKQFNYCLTGASGFVGSHLAEYLSQQDEVAKVVCLVRQSSDTSFLETLPVEIARVDFEQPQSIQPYLQDMDYFFHIAGVLGGGERKMKKGNHQLALDMFNLYRENAGRIKGFLMTSSIAAVGPMDYGHDDATRQHDLNPLSIYGHTKLAGEKELWPYFNDGKHNVSVVRAPIVFGPRETDVRQFFELVRKGIAPVLGKGTNEVTLIHVHDLVRFMHKLIQDDTHQGIFYTYSDELFNWNKLAEEIKTILNPKARTIHIPPFVMYAAAVLNEWVGNNPTLSREKYREGMAKSWAYEQNDFNLSGEKIIYSLRKGVEELYT